VGAARPAVRRDFQGARPMIAFTKTLDPEQDYPALAPELFVVDRIGIEGQHEHRRFEYALALRTLTVHRTPLSYYHVLDVGGAGSTFVRMVPVGLLGGEVPA